MLTPLWPNAIVLGIALGLVLVDEEEKDDTEVLKPAVQKYEPTSDPDLVAATKGIMERLQRMRDEKKLPSDIQQVALRKLRMIKNAININDLRVPPANQPEKLSSDREGQCSIRINDQWRICFEWKNSDAFNVEIADYH